MFAEVTVQDAAAASPAAPRLAEATSKPLRDIWVSLGLSVAALSAAFSSFDGLKNIAEAAGWSPYMAPLFALSIDAYALTAIRVWLTRGASPRAAAFARRNAAGAVALSLLGNAAWHLIDAGLLAVTWPVVLGVGSVPPVILGLVTHLAMLRKQTDDLSAPDVTRRAVDKGDVLRPSPGRPQATAGDDSRPAPVAADDIGRDRPSKSAAARVPRRSSAKAVRRLRSEDELLLLAREADAAYRERYGRGITRDALRSALKVGGSSASQVLARLKAEQGAHG
ncbi:DUF2637 domain-containing protein [Allorhizocola rhizosphaerae]|uniref:DUF2637 domain-containing protein n=1 Tax=Allorhizocola rhizosphaerae TaxID=1872709 RepID=UPI0013C2F2CC|nr:DUF2637 domain-containing protein [Allorhizocola rhizosphaerae]